MLRCVHRKINEFIHLNNRVRYHNVLKLLDCYTVPRGLVKDSSCCSIRKKYGLGEGKPLKLK